MWPPGEQGERAHSAVPRGGSQAEMGSGWPSVSRQPPKATPSPQQRGCRQDTPPAHTAIETHGHRPSPSSTGGLISLIPHGSSLYLWILQWAGQDLGGHIFSYLSEHRDFLATAGIVQVFPFTSLMCVFPPAPWSPTLPTLLAHELLDSFLLQGVCGVFAQDFLWLIFTWVTAPLHITAIMSTQDIFSLGLKSLLQNLLQTWGQCTVRQWKSTYTTSHTH